MYQRTIIIGRLGADPSMRYTQDGTPVTGFSVATDERWNDASGKQQQRTTWFRVTAWKKLGEICNQYLKKGGLVMVEGELAEPKPYQKSDGSWGASLDLRAQTIKFLSGKGDAQEETQEDNVPF